MSPTYACVQVRGYCDCVNGGVLVALRSRGLTSITCWLVLTAILIAAAGDRTYLFRVANGVDPRVVSLAELALVLSVSCIPAIGFPSLWTWERCYPRLVMRVASGVLVPGAMVSAGTFPWWANSVFGHFGSHPPGVMFCNAMVFGGSASLACTWFGRRLGPLVGVSGFLGGVVAQALQVPLPVPFQHASTSFPAYLLAVVMIGLASLVLATSMGRTKFVVDA